jgi:hypothetical protein
MDKLPTVKKDAEDLLKPAHRRFWRGALASLTAAIGASFAFASTAPAAVPNSAPALSGTQEIRGSMPKLVLRSAARLVRFAQHDSHESHASHESHESHVSGQ